jgi:hypothetical protein
MGHKNYKPTIYNTHITLKKHRNNRKINDKKKGQGEMNRGTPPQQ